jgi:tetratricopeptide (TPR) repeat protein
MPDHLTKSQKKFLKKNLWKLPSSQLAQRLNLSETNLHDYLKTVLPLGKWEKWAKQERVSSQSITEKTPPPFLPNNLWAWFKQNWLYFAFLSLLVIIVYFNSLNNDFLSDDLPAIVENKNLGNIFYLLRHHTINFSRYFLYSLVYQIFGLKPIYFRLINVFFHLGCAGVIFTLLSFLYGSFLALTVASIFAVHPLLLESVTWISGGIYAQYSFFILLSFLLYLIARQRHWPAKFYWISVIFFVPALFTTEKAAVLPGLLFVFEFAFGRLLQNWKRLMPYFALSALVAAVVFGGGQLNQRVSALKTDYYQEGSFYNPLTQIPTAIASYLWLIIWPDKLTLYHSEMRFSKVEYLAMSLIALVFFTSLIYTLGNKKYRQYGYWLAFFIIGLSPMITPLKVAWIVAERYVYLGSIGIFALIGLGIQKLYQSKSKGLAYFSLGILLALLSARTIIRNIDWKNQDNLWLSAARTSPSSPQNHNNLGDLYSRRNDFPRAEEEFKKAIDLLPNYGDARHNLANVYLRQNKVDLAIASYRKALECNPNIWQSHQNLAVIYLHQKQLDLAEQHLSKAIAINPQNPPLLINLGLIYLNSGKKKEAKEAWQKALAIDPSNQEARKLLQNHFP